MRFVGFGVWGRRGNWRIGKSMVAYKTNILFLIVIIID